MTDIMKAMRDVVKLDITEFFNKEVVKIHEMIEEPANEAAVRDAKKNQGERQLKDLNKGLGEMGRIQDFGTRLSDKVREFQQAIEDRYDELDDAIT